jgi:hypothetical protein
MATKGTLAERVRGRPPSRLVSGELLPGSRFKMTYFGTEYGVSLSVVRQAVTRHAESRDWTRPLPSAGTQPRWWCWYLCTHSTHADPRSFTFEFRSTCDASVAVPRCTAD